MRKMPRELAACAFWVAAVVTFGEGVSDTLREHNYSIGVAIGLFLANIACVLTVWAVVDRCAHQPTVEDIALLVETMHHKEPARPQVVR